MTTIYTTYYDNIERAGYMPELIIENWQSCDRRVIFCSSTEYNKLKHLDAEIVTIGISINRPSDIPVAQNACVNYCFDAGADHVMYIMGDIYMTAEGDAYASKLIASGEMPNNIPVMGVQLYSNMWWHLFCCTISDRSYKAHFDELGDGENCNLATINRSWNHENRPYLLDLGYLGIKQYIAKMVNHHYLWPDPYKWKFLDLYKKNKQLAVQYAYDSMKQAKQNPIEPIDYPTYEYIINKLDQYEDYLYCTGLI